MISLHNRLVSSFCLAIVLFSLGFVCSCKSKPLDAREEFVRSLKGADVNGYLFATKEEDNQITTSLTNGALRSPVKLDSGASLVLGYATVKDKKANTTKTLKAEISKTDSAVTLRVTDITANELVLNEIFAPRTCPIGQPVFNNLTECFDDFDCKVRPEILCAVNRTCKIQLFDLECCLKDGTRVHALVIVRPTARRCLIAFPFDIDTLVLSP